VTTIEQTKIPVRIPFVCPVCAGQNAIELLILSRAGGAECIKCEKWLKAADVMRAIHAPRAAASEEGPQMRMRAPPAKRPDMVWPPTAESRAAIAPLRKQRGGGN
jgi:hypothetical protein